ncbi:unnamed protein product [Prunus armeniaca]
MKLSGIIVNILKWDFWLKDGIAPVSRRHSLSPARRSLSPLVRDSHRGRPRFGRPFARPATKVDGAGTKMTGPPSSSYPGQVPPPAAVISPENEEKSSGFDRNFAGFVLRRPTTDSGKQLDLRIGFRPDFGMRFRPLPVSFWGTSKNKSDSKLGVLPRVGVLSRDLWFFRRCDIALDTHALPARVAARGHCS